MPNLRHVIGILGQSISDKLASMSFCVRKRALAGAHRKCWQTASRKLSFQSRFAVWQPRLDVYVSGQVIRTIIVIICVSNLFHSRYVGSRNVFKVLAYEFYRLIYERDTKTELAIVYCDGILFQRHRNGDDNDHDLIDLLSFIVRSCSSYSSRIEFKWSLAQLFLSLNVRTTSSFAIFSSIITSFMFLPFSLKPDNRNRRKSFLFFFFPSMYHSSLSLYPIYIILSSSIILFVLRCFGAFAVSCDTSNRSCVLRWSIYYLCRTVFELYSRFMLLQCLEPRFSVRSKLKGGGKGRKVPLQVGVVLERSWYGALSITSEDHSASELMEFRIN